MNNNINKQSSQNNRDLHSLFRSQIVQKYPPEPEDNRINNHAHHHFTNPIFMEDQAHHNNAYDQPQQIDFMDSFWAKDQEIVEEYVEVQKNVQRRSIMNFDNLMASQSDNNEVPSRNSSLSSKDNNHLDFNAHNRSYEKMPHLVNLKKFSEQFAMDAQQIPQNRRSIGQYKLPQTPIKLKLEIQSRDRERNQKINKIQQVGCNCRKSKCLKMYCQCFHLQIFCSQNCNCVDCGNSQPNEGHQQAVIDALTRNPKAFQQQKPQVQKGFTLGVELAEVKKGCKCKKTKCLKKYCECYSTGSKCGIFCKCQSCQNN